ncbi:hypothetical protein F5051DRAFT_446414 [Lentinula edodes]|nr:hypothetical protein F5051DRAFT_446414 [Lentinula edodes]
MSTSSIEAVSESHPVASPPLMPSPVMPCFSLPTRIGYTSPPHRSGGYALRSTSTPPGPAIRSTQAPQLPLVRLPSPAQSGEVDIDKLASSVEDPPLGQLTMFKSVFGVGVSLARYVVDDPLWPLLAAAGLPCSSCVRSKKSGSCSVVPNLARCSNCDDKKPCILGQLAQFRYFARKCSCNLSYAHRFLEVHGNPGQRTRFSLLPEQWRTIANKIESSTSSTRVLLELSLLNDQDQLEEDCLELQDFVHCQPKFPTIEETIQSGPCRSPAPGKVSSIPKKRKQTIRGVGEASSLKPKRSVEQDSGLGNAPDYCHVVLVLPPQATSHSEVVEPHTPSCGDAPKQASPPLPSPGVPSSFPPHVDASYGSRMTQSGSFGQFIPPTLTATVPRDWLKSPPFLQHNRETLRPYPRSHINTSLKTENDNLKSEVTEQVSSAENVTLTSLLRETSSSLNDRSRELESSCQALQEVSADRVEYQRVLTQFRAIEAELPDLPSEDVLTHFFLAQSEQIADVDKCSFETHEELDAVNARAMRLRDRLEELEESVHRYRSRVHVAEGLIRQYPEDEGLYEVDLPSLSSMQDRLNESEALAHPPEQMCTVVELVLDYLSQGRFTHGELHLRSISSLLYYYSNAADHVDGLYQEGMWMLVPGLWNPLFTAGSSPLDIPSLFPKVPSMDSIMLDWECMIAGYVSEVLGYPVPSFAIPTAVGASHTGDPDASSTHVSVPGTSPVLGATIPPPTETPLFLPESLSPSSPIPSSASLPNSPREVVDLTMEDDDELYESWEEFLVRMGETSEIKQEPSDPNVI